MKSNSSASAWGNRLLISTMYSSFIAGKLLSIEGKHLFGSFSKLLYYLNFLLSISNFFQSNYSTATAKFAEVRRC